MTCRVCLEPCDTLLRCLCRDGGHKKCILQSCASRYARTKVISHLLMCEVCNHTISEFAYELARQAYQITKTDEMYMLMITASECTDTPDCLDESRPMNTPEARFFHGYMQVMKTDPCGDACEAYILLYKHLMKPLIQSRLILEVAAKYMQCNNEKRAIAICEAEADRLGDINSTRDPDVLSIISQIVAITGHLKPELALSFEKARDRIHGVMGPYHDHTINFDMGISVAYCMQGRYDIARLKLLDLVRVLRKIRPKHHKDTLAMTCWLVGVYEKLNMFKQADPLKKYLIQHGFSFDD